MYRRYTIIVIVLALLVTGLSCLMKGKADKTTLPQTISYNFHVRPILSDKCFKCHGPDGNKRQADLRLDIPDSAYAPLKETKGAFAIIPGNPEESELYKRISSADSLYYMPPPESHLGMLADHEIAIMKKWIQQGAKYEKHWAFIQPQKHPLPDVSDNKDWIKNEIDYFILSKLDEKNLEPNEEASREHLLKKASLDITGLPPSLDMMDKFLANNNENAYEQIIDALLSTPQYGERMAVHWLDVARYADSYGYQDDNIRTQWPWRDWLIHAFNKNLPYDEFLTWQIAGDMLPNATKEQILATGFFRNHKYTEEGGVVPEEYRVEYLVDKTKTYSKGLLGITVECAQCHDHKYDPFSQREYYSLLAFFNNTKEKGYEGDVSVSKPAKHPLLKISDEDVQKVLTFVNKKDTGMMTVSVLAEDTLRNTYLLDRGRYDAPSYQVFPAAINAVMPFDTTQYKKNRLGLAQWTVSKNNPLTARVFVNQLWQEFFGRGLVKTSGDFGMQGELPSHPELLDWLAVDFMEHGWDIKRLVKQLVLSATYRQSTKTTKEKYKSDPENVYLSHGPRNRLSAEFIRDLVLSSSGLLVKTIGGPSVKPYQPKGVWESSTSGRGELATYKQDKGDALYRRGMYTFIKLTAPPPGMIMFDASNRDQCEVKRLKTNTPLQALVMMNDPTVLEASSVLAQRLMNENISVEQKIQKAFRLIICRKPGTNEQKILTSYFEEQLQLFRQNKLNARLTLKAGEFVPKDISDINSCAALMKTINMIYNMEEAITKT